MFDTFSVDAAKIDKKTNSPKRTAKNCKKRKRKTMTVRYRTNSRQEQAAHAEQCRPYPRGRDDEQQEHDHLYWEFHETDMMGVRMGDRKRCKRTGDSFGNLFLIFLVRFFQVSKFSLSLPRNR